MKQIIQDLSSGETILENVPAPMVRRGAVLVRTRRSLVSLGTERMLVEFGKASYLEKVRQQPEKVKQVMDKIKTDGLRPTLEAVFRKLGEPLPLGYCNVGEVIAVGAGVTDFKIGDRVASNGHHAEIVCVSQNLVAKIPDNVTYDHAAFTVIGAIGLQGIRLIHPTFGETIVVTGLGLIGLISGQLLLANGCRVIGLDYDEKKVALAKSFGIDAYTTGGDTNPVTLVESLTHGIGADGVLITASSKSNEVISQAAGMCRKKGRIVLVGVVGLDINRSDFFKKELSFQVSCSYGPGRYDENYEEKGHDYPIGYVRWTEKRNFEAVLTAIEKDQIQVESLITDRVKLDDYRQIYDNMSQSKSIASLLVYEEEGNQALQTQVVLNDMGFSGLKGVLGIIGAGNFTGSTILPMLKKVNAKVKTIASSKGLSGTTLAKKFGVALSTTDYRSILADRDIDAVIITTRHNAHARQVIESLQAGKHVFVEKPLALTMEELDEIDLVKKGSDKTLTVGFNRRFSPFILDARKQLGESDVPINVIAIMNAGFIPQDVWVQDTEVGGGRIIGEACHLIDLITSLTGSLVESVVMNAMGNHPSENTDNASILLQYKNGSTGTIHYFSNGSKSYSKERIEIYSQNRTIIIDNFRKSYYHGFKSSGMSRTQDKGHFEQFKLFTDRLKNGGPPIIPYEEIINTSRTAIAAVASLKSRSWLSV